MNKEDYKYIIDLLLKLPYYNVSLLGENKLKQKTVVNLSDVLETVFELNVKLQKAHGIRYANGIFYIPRQK